MELSLLRKDLLHLSTLHRGCVALLPSSSKRAGGRQPLAAGDDSGALRLLTLGKKGEVETIFETAANPKAPITRISLAGEAGGAQGRGREGGQRAGAGRGTGGSREGSRGGE
eukprot:scaffold23271_cov27-Tisochrysis_lutea.AAC.1